MRPMENERDPREPYWAFAERYPDEIKEAIERLGYRRVREIFSGRPQLDESNIVP